MRPSAKVVVNEGNDEQRAARKNDPVAFGALSVTLGPAGVTAVLWHPPDGGPPVTFSAAPTTLSGDDHGEARRIDRAQRDPYSVPPIDGVILDGSGLSCASLCRAREQRQQARRGTTSGPARVRRISWASVSRRPALETALDL